MSTSELSQKVLQLPREERQNLLELLTESLHENDPASPDWHGEVLENRLAKIEDGEAKFHTIEEIRTHFGLEPL